MLPPDKETKLQSNNQETFLRVVKNTPVAVEPCCAWKYVPANVSSSVIIPKVLGVICDDRWVSSQCKKIILRKESLSPQPTVVTYFSGYIIKSMETR